MPVKFIYDLQTNTLGLSHAGRSMSIQTSHIVSDLIQCINHG